MRKLEIDELRQRQIEILDVVSSFCDKNEIDYILEGGTLLGAIRHGGYIPWDDDIDIGMLRKDYDRFAEIFPREMADTQYVFECPEKNKNWHLPFGKVMDMNTLFVQDGHDLGINIDVFPYDDVPNDYKVAEQMYKKRDFLKKINAVQINENAPRGGVLRRSIVYVIRFLLRLFPRYYFIHCIANSARKYEGKGYETVGNFTAESKIPPCKKEIVTNRILAKFEGKEYKIPKDYDTWLRAFYGEYMKLPPEDQRKRHTFEAYI